MRISGAGLFKTVALVVIVLFAWKKGLPWFHENFRPTDEHSSIGDSGRSGSLCVDRATNASNELGSGVGRFVNPPYDIAAWDTFRIRVDTRTTDAEAACSCSSDSCNRAQEAMGNLRTLTQQLDAAIRNGTAPPGDIVHTQDTIDQGIEAARRIASRGN
ncbi:MAG: hypothetical protein ABI718_02540 [Acidobacteriota bacterium]